MEFIATFDNTLEFSRYFDDNNIIEIKLNETVNPADSFMLGAAPSAKLELTLVFEEPPAIQFETAIIKPYIGLVLNEATVEYVPIGVFYVDDISWHKKNRVTLTCFDGMVKLEKAYLTQLEYPAPLKDVAQEIADKAGVTLATTALPDTPVEGLYGYTLREAISFIASFIGGFARFNREGELEINGYKTTNFEITADNYFNLETAENPFAIGRLTCIVGEDEEGNQIVLTAGTTGNEIVFTNPLMTQEQLDSIYQTLSQLSYMPYMVDWRGNPALEAGDKIKIIDVGENEYITLLMEQQIRYTGGVSATAEAKGKTEFAQEFQSTGPLTQQISRTSNAVKAYADRLAQDIADGKYTGTFIDETTIYSPIIAGQEGRFIGEVKVGTGNDLAGISGEGSTADSIRFWAGHADKNQAPFQVTQTGFLKSTNAEITGSITVTGGNAETVTGAQSKADAAETSAKSHADTILQALANGEFQGGTFIDRTMIYSPVIAGQEGRFIGEVKVGTGNDLAGISGEGTSASSIRFWAGHADKEQAPFRVTQDGTIHAAKGEFGGTIVGKIVRTEHFANLYHPITIQGTGNYDASNPFTLKFHVSSRMVEVLDARLNIELARYRRETKGAAATTPNSVTSASGGSATSTSTANGGHSHTMHVHRNKPSGTSSLTLSGIAVAGTYNSSIAPDGESDWLSNAMFYRTSGSSLFGVLPTTSNPGNHTHNVSIPSHTHSVRGQTHEHDIIDGITVSPSQPTGVTVKVNGQTIASNLSNAGTQVNNIGFASHVTTGWNTIEVSGANVGRAHIAAFVEVVLNT